MGNSKGTADVEFENAEDAQKAVRMFNSKYLFVTYLKILILKEWPWKLNIIKSSQKNKKELDSKKVLEEEIREINEEGKDSNKGRISYIHLLRVFP